MIKESLSLIALGTASLAKSEQRALVKNANIAKIDNFLRANPGDADFTVVDTIFVSETVTETQYEVFTQTETATDYSTVSIYNSISTDFELDVTVTQTETQTIDYTTFYSYSSCYTTTIHSSIFETETSTYTSVDTETYFVTYAPYTTEIDVITDTSTFTSTFTDYETMTTVVTTTIDFVVCTEADSTIIILFDNLSAFNDQQVAALDNFQQNSFLVNFSFFLYSNEYGNSLTTYSTMQGLMAQMVFQLQTFQSALLVALLNGQSQADQLAAFTQYQSDQMALLAAFQASQLLTPDYAALSLSDQQFLVNSVFPFKTNQYLSFQASQMTAFLAFQASQQPYY